MCYYLSFVFFKQKTAYELRISDWSSDVCSSDLLEQPGMGEWVRYKLDQATEHILIDEAQDTNLAQWTIIARLAEEFFAGEGAHGDRARTLFTVEIGRASCRERVCQYV